MSFSLTGCQSSVSLKDVPDALQKIAKTGSGLLGSVTSGVRDTVALAHQTAQTVQAGVREVRQRIAEAGSGVQKIQEGAALLRKGVVGK